MTRIGTLLGADGRPEGRVQIIRKNKKTTRITRAVDHGRAWAATDEVVDTDQVLDDGGALWEQHSRNPKHATLLSTFREPTARLQVQRAYKTVIKARLYEGDNRWSGVEDFSPKNVRFDGGASWGWDPPAFDQPAPEPTNEPAAAATGIGGVTAPRGQRVSYIRVSSVDQNLARQRDALGSVDREFRDEISARSRDNRPGLDDCLAYLRHGDTLYVASIDRLARSLVDLRTIIDQITDKGASVHFVKEHLTFSAESTDPRATLMLGVLGSFAEFERSIIRERQAEGIALAKKAGKYKGRKRALSPEEVEKARKRVDAGESKVAIAKDLGVGRATLYRALKG